MMSAAAFLVLSGWLYLICGRGAFWLSRVGDSAEAAEPPQWPRVAAVVPARDEAECIKESIHSLLTQKYPGAFTVTLVDDDSGDATADIARGVAQGVGRPLSIVMGRALPAGWTGKMWALKQGIAAAEQSPNPPDYLLLTDADIVHAADTVAWLVARAELHGFVLTSLMAQLRCETLAERVHVPAFIFFFQMLYPFAWVNRAELATAAAAGGCMLVRTDALRAAGGVESIRDALIDDCTLARVLKARGPVWLGLTRRVRSIRPNPSWTDFRRMVARSAYAQLRYSPLLLLATILGMGVTFLAPPLLALFASGLPQWLGIAAWALMALAFQPTLCFYGLSPLWGVALPAIAFLYMVYTVDSAIQYASGRGGRWKGRIQANVSAQ